MDFELSQTQERIREAAAAFVQSEVAPVAAELDKTGNREILKKILKGLAVRGFMGITIDPAYGGMGADSVSFSLVMAELGRACASTSVTTSVTNMVAEVIQRIGTEEQKARFIPPLCSGEFAAGGFALTEPQAGSDPASMGMSAVPEGNHWVLNGSKIFISSAEFAGIFVVWAVTDREARKGRGISAFLVEASTPGFRVGKKEKKLGQLASPTNEIVFDHCLVPQGNLLGKLNDGFRIAASELAGGRIGIGSMALGIGLGALEYASEHIARRGRSDPVTRCAIADNYTRLSGARLLLLKAAMLKDQRQYYAKEASMAKVYATEAADMACQDAVRLLGEYGCAEDCPVERFYRDVRVTRIYEGTSEIQRLIIARELLR